MDKRLKLSVHQLVDFLLRSGSIDNRVFNKSSMSEGVRLHAFYQNRQGNDYLSEYSLQSDFLVDDFTITIEGRADGIIEQGNHYIIDEIKSTVIELNDFYQENKAWHLGQAQCYALMFMRERDLNEIDIRLTYLHQSKEEQMIREFHYTRTELEEIVNSLIHNYLNFYNTVYVHRQNRNISASTLHFPFNNFREGQKELARYTYAIAAQGGQFYCEAPTGIGKTISTLYPACRAFAQERIDKIFYFTAKTSGQEAAHQALLTMKETGLNVNPIVITAKDKICFNPGKACNPDECPFARNYYNKIRNVLLMILKQENDFSLDTIIKYAFDNEVCPFEMQLDLSLFSDVIICDYNYLFDPLVYMRRFFDTDGSNYFALIDEAHNLVERTRDMYSAVLDSSDFAHLKTHLRKLDHPRIKSLLRRLIKNFAALNSEIDESSPQRLIDDLPTPLYNNLNAFILAGQDVMHNYSDFADEQFRDVFFAVNRFLKIYEYVDDSFRIYYEESGDLHRKLHILNLDPSRLIHTGLTQVYGAVLFSATLSPINYYVQLLGGNKLSPRLILHSPFPSANRRLLIAPGVATTYRRRQDSYGAIADYLQTIYRGKIGNYLFFFPSYDYLEKVQSYLEDLSKTDKFDLFVQTRDMDSDAQKQFLARFQSNPKRSRVGLAVLGGAFSEGVDLVADRLIGVAVIGVGLPQISFERNLIREYYATRELPGFIYAYVNPGMNRVMQAVGRLIRSAADRGVVMLLDERYLQSRYRDLFRSEWDDYEVVTSLEDATTIIDEFWKN